MAPSCDETVHALTCCLLSIDELTRRRPGIMTRNLSKGTSDKGLMVSINHHTRSEKRVNGIKK